MKFLNVDRNLANLFSYVLGYIFSASNITTGVIALVLTRYVSDAIYLKDYDKVLPSLYGGVIITLIPGMILYFALLLAMGTELVFTILTGIFFGLVNISWILIIYLGALSNHKKILKIFFIGLITIIIALAFCYFANKDFVVYFIIMSLNLGFTVISALLYMEIRNYFGEGRGSLWTFFGYFKKFPSLIFINIFYIAGLYFEGFYFNFFSSTASINFLQVLYASSFVLIPGMIYFVVRFETNFFESHNILFNTINKKGTYEDIELAKENLKNVFRFEFQMLFRVVCIFLFVIIFLGVFYFLENRASKYTILSFCVVSIGMCSTILMYVVKIIFLYFDQKNYALIITTVFFTLNIAISVLENNLQMQFFGLGLLGASSISFFVGLILLKIFFKRMDYYLFKIA
jgi:uncharacterized membrane protein